MFDRQTAKVLLTILIFALVLAIVYVARGVIIVFVFAILSAYLIDPVVRFLQRHSLFFENLRGPHILEAYLGFLILIAVSIGTTCISLANVPMWPQDPRAPRLFLYYLFAACFLFDVFYIFLLRQARQSMARPS